MKKRTSDFQDIVKYNRKHSKHTDVHVPCNTFDCKYKEIVFGALKMGVQVEDSQYFCRHPDTPGTPVNMTCWWGGNAPNWCPKRKQNGGAF